MDQVEGHPIPQDITGFQFRLIGDMTIKQFAYLAGGFLLAWLIFSLPIIEFIKIPIAACIGLLGVIFAFIPIQGRPADVMVLLFLKAVFKPNQYTYKKTPIATTTHFTGDTTPAQHPAKEEQKEQLSTFLDTTHQPSFMPPIIPENKDDISEEKHPEVTPLPETPAGGEAPAIEQQEEVLTEQLSDVSQQLDQAKKEEQAPGSSMLEAHEKVTSLESQLQDILTQKQDLEKQVIALQHKLTTTPQHAYTPTTIDVPEETQHVKKIPLSLKQSVGAPLIPDVPNLITGVVKDPRGNVLPNILIEVKDRDNNAVRAFKTNQLGQFVSATPLLNGTYTISFEDPKKENTFDTIELSAAGESIPPLEVISVDEREELRKSLFTT